MENNKEKYGQKKESPLKGKEGTRLGRKNVKPSEKAQIIMDKIQDPEITQEELAQKHGWDDSTVGKILKNCRELSNEDLTKELMAKNTEILALGKEGIFNTLVDLMVENDGKLPLYALKEFTKILKDSFNQNQLMQGKAGTDTNFTLNWGSSDNKEDKPKELPSND